MWARLGIQERLAGRADGFDDFVSVGGMACMAGGLLPSAACAGPFCLCLLGLSLAIGQGLPCGRFPFSSPEVVCGMYGGLDCWGGFLRVVELLLDRIGWVGGLVVNHQQGVRP